VVTSGGSLAISNGITFSGEPLTLNGNGTAGGNNNGALRSLDTASPVTIASPITLASSARIRAADGGELILTSPITDNGSNYTLTLHAEQTNTLFRVSTVSNTVGTVTLYGNNTTRGQIRFDVVNAFPFSLVNIGGGLFNLNGNNQSLAGLGNGFNPSLGVITNSSGSPAVLTVNYSGTNTAQLLSAIAGNLSFVKTGTGVQSFGGGVAIKHTYTGTTTINEGVLGIASDLSGVTGSFTVNSGGTLRGSGNTIGGPVTVNAGGTIYAGFAANALGDLTISNSLTLAGNLIVAINKDVAPSNDVFNVTGALTYGGTLVITNLGTNALGVGDTFRIFPTGGTGSFTLVQPEGATLGFTDGLLTVLSVGATPPTPVPLTNSIVGGTNLILSWPAGQGWRLEYQTNALNQGLGTNWLPATDSSVSSTNILIDRSRPAVFYRLVYP
jgi:autotransporter-associated beta strand protein